MADFLLWIISTYVKRRRGFLTILWVGNATPVLIKEAEVTAVVTLISVGGRNFDLWILRKKRNIELLNLESHPSLFRGVSNLLSKMNHLEQCGTHYLVGGSTVWPRFAQVWGQESHLENAHTRRKRRRSIRKRCRWRCNWTKWIILAKGISSRYVINIQRLRGRRMDTSACVLQEERRRRDQEYTCHDGRKVQFFAGGRVRCFWGGILFRS